MWGVVWGSGVGAWHRGVVWGHGTGEWCGGGARGVVWGQGTGSGVGAWHVGVWWGCVRTCGEGVECKEGGEEAGVEVPAVEEGSLLRSRGGGPSLLRDLAGTRVSCEHQRQVPAPGTSARYVRVM